MFGSDSLASDYNVDYVKSIINNDNKILDELCISNEIKQKMFSTNLLRFLGLDK